MPTPSAPMPPVPALLDGGMGRELRFRGIDILTPSWSAAALLSAPEVVRAVHRDYIAAGADVITTNSYGIVRSALAEEGIEDRFEEMNERAGRLAAEARDEAAAAAGRDVWIAGSLPPLNGSYRADLVLPRETLEPLYREQAALLAPWVDFFLCETMSSIPEGLAAAAAACGTCKPVWVSFTLHEDRSGRLRSGETMDDAVRSLADLPVSGILANCCAPESITAALPALLASGKPWAGGYANTFEPVPETWTLGDADAGKRSLSLRDDLDPAEYLAQARGWWEAGATVVGGCCGTRPAHIAAIDAAWAR